MMNVVISSTHCLPVAEDCLVSIKDNCLSHTRRLTDSDLIIEFNSLDASSMTLDESVCIPQKVLKSEYYPSIRNPLKKHNEQGTSFNSETAKTSQDDATAITAATTVIETETVSDDSTLATVASSSTVLNQPQSMKRVSFGSLTIHEHVVELGGSGVPRVGPAISLGWHGDSHVTVDSIEAYEDARPCLPRKGVEMLLPKRQRVEMLLASGYTFNQIRLSTQECETVQKARARTVQRLSFIDRTKSTLKKLVVFKKSE